MTNAPGIPDFARGRRMPQWLGWALLIVLGAVIGGLGEVMYPWIYFAAVDAWGFAASLPLSGRVVGQPGALKILPILIILMGVGFVAVCVLVGLASLNVPFSRAAGIPRRQWIPVAIVVPLAVCGLLLFSRGVVDLTTGYSYF